MMPEIRPLSLCLSGRGPPHPGVPRAS